MERHYITRTGIEKLVAELNEWRHDKRPAMVRQLASARSHGDLSENAEYHAAREELARIDQKIMQLEMTLQSAVLMDETSVNTDQVRILTRVKVLDNHKKVERIYSLVSPAEANPTEGKISHQSPVGQGLIGKKVGETVEIQIPSGTVSWTILEISPIQT
ncbi:transcription elongation factor GreA [candidate division KSB1 bacterium]|nr:MAG: transcription elongation factor GreA [candidate division KSB1 bacterium]